jgi:hypothetical protein
MGGSGVGSPGLSMPAYALRGGQKAACTAGS